MDTSPLQAAAQHVPTETAKFVDSQFTDIPVTVSQIKPRTDIPTNRHDIGIKIVDHFHRDERFTKYTLYTIAGSDNKGSFEVARRYSDFVKLRSTLVLRWPGCYIPPLPAKNVMVYLDRLNNMETEFLKDRRAALELFLQKAAELTYLHYSPEYQTFLRYNGGNLTNELKQYQRISYEEIVKRYTETFQHLSRVQSADEASIIITRFKSFLYKMHGKFKSFRALAKEAAKAKKNYYNSMAAFHENVAVEYERDVISEYQNHENLRTVFGETNNPQFDMTIKKMKVSSKNDSLEHFDNWLTIECREIEALFEAIQQKERYETLRTKANERHRGLNEDIHTIESGNFHWKTLLTSKSKDQKVSQIQTEACEHQKAIDQLNLLVDMIMLVLAYDEIGKFKANKPAKFYQLVDLAAQNELDNLHNMADYWTVIQKNNKNKPEQPLNTSGWL